MVTHVLVEDTYKVNLIFRQTHVPVVQGAELLQEWMTIKRVYVLVQIVPVIRSFVVTITVAVIK